MNHAYRLVWNEATQTYVPAAEGTRARKKRGGCKSFKHVGIIVAAAVVGSSFVTTAHAGPSGGEVVAGQASIEHSGVTTMINQQSQNVSLNWQQFNVAANETVQFVQPSATSIALNRVIGSEASQIFGQLSANGRVFLINPNGVLFGPSAQVDVGGLVASTLNISDEDFLAGRYQFTSNSATSGSIVNQGTITAVSGGYVALLGGQVSNQGTISAQLGTVALAAGSGVSLDFTGQQLLNVRVDAATLDALAHNQQLIQANGGTVIMTAAARDALLSTVVNNTGVIEARSVQNHDGVIKLLGSFEGGTVHVGGTLNASAVPIAGEGAVNGGFIDTSGAHVEVADGARVSTLGSGGGKAGTWLIDPTDFTIAAGSAPQTGSGIGADTLATNLATTSVEIQTVADGSEPGDIHVNADVSWNAATTLTLTAHHDVNVNAVITHTGSSGGVTLRADSQGACVAGAAASACGTVNFAGTGRITAANVNLYYNPAGSNAAAGANGVGPSYAPTNYAANVTVTGTFNAYMLVNDVNQLQAMNTRLGGGYALGRDIDASATRGWNGGEGFVPIGNSTTPFTGHFDGLGHTVSELFIDRPGTDHVGLFGVVDLGSTTIRSVGLLGGSISGHFNVGALVGDNEGTVSDAYATAAVRGAFDQVGGLVGFNLGTVSNAYASGAVSGNESVGGLVGYSEGTVSNAYASGAVNGRASVGGLVGYNTGTVSNAYASGAVSGVFGQAGGLVGFNRGTVSNAYATGAISGDDFVGGLVGANNGFGTVSNAYASGAVSGDNSVGGLVGENFGTVSNAYASGAVNGRASVGGLVGYNIQTVSVSFWDVNTTGQATSAGGGTALGTSQFMTPSSFSGFDFTTTWVMIEGNTRPFLRSEYSTTITNAHQLQLMALDLSASYVLANDIDMSELTNVSGLWNTASGFVPIGNDSSRFTGLFDGLGHTVSDLFIDRPGTSHVGLFGAASSGSTIRNVGLLGGLISGTMYVGALVGWSAGTVSNAYATGAVGGWQRVGGLVGANVGTVRDAYATGEVGGEQWVGGLVGANVGTVRDAYATGTVSGWGVIGGLVGVNDGTVSNAYATGAVSGEGEIGGLVGGNTNTGTLTDAYATGVVDGQVLTGGLVGSNAGAVSRTYATGRVDGGDAASTGGLVGGTFVGGTVTDSFWDTETSLQGDHFDGRGTGRTSAEMRDVDTFSAWDISAVGGSTATWRIYDGYTGPLLRSFLARATVAIDDVSATYNGTNQGANFNYDAGSADTNLIFRGTVNARNAGSYNLGEHLYSGQQGYDIVYTGGALNIGRANMVLSTSDVVKTYDGTTSASGTAMAVGGTTLFGGDSLSGGTFAFTDRNAGIGNRTVTTSGVTVNDGNSGGNYNVTYVDNTTSTINRASLIVGTRDVVKTYDGTTNASGTAVATGGTTLFGGDSLSGGTFAFTDRNAGIGNRTVTTSGVTVNDGNSGGNYNVTYVDNTISTINRASLIVGTRDVVKTYDGTTNASSTAVVTGGTLFGGDRLSGGTFAFTDRNAGIGNRTVTASGVVVNDGNGGGNYDVTYVDNTTSTIHRADLTLAASSDTRIYDGTTASAGSVNAAGIVSGDAVSATQAFASRNVMGTGGSTLQVAGYSITDSGGADMSGNYNVSTTTAAGTITAATLTVGGAIEAADRTYDATVAATVTGGVLTGVIGTDEVALMQSGAFSDKNVGADKLVTTTFRLAGSDAGNYVLARDTATTTASITPRALTVIADDQTKRQGTPNPALTLSYSGFAAGESAADLTTRPTASTSANLGSPAGQYAITASGAASSNYVFTYVPGTLTVSSTQARGYQETLSYLDDIRSEDASEPDDEDERLKGNPLLLEIRDGGIRLPAGVQ